MTSRARIAVLIALLAGVVLAATSAGLMARGRDGASTPLPQHLRDTGLFVAGSVNTIRPEHLPFTPQYALWSDGAGKRRWLALPAGTSIDATRPDAWEFPRGTRLWKEFSYGTRKVETRFIERLADGSWRYAVYVWNEAGTDAVLAPAEGLAAVAIAEAPGGRHVIPAQADCRVCHEGAAVPVLGASALQLSPDRDPLAPHAREPEAGSADLRSLVARGWLRNLPPAMLRDPPRIVAASPVERAALGYLHANCGHCHNDGGVPAPVGLVIAQDPAAGAASTPRVLRSMLGASSRFRPSAQRTSERADEMQAAQPQLVAPGHADASVLALRMRLRNPYSQMPPLGTRVVDADGLALIEHWINHDLPTRKEIAP
jgi:hypothetical protein